MALTETRPDPTAAAPPPAHRPAPGPLERLIGSGDHLSIGRLFIGFSLVLLALALVGRLVLGLDLATDNGILGDNQGMLGTSSLVGLAFVGAIPLLLGLAITVVPLQLGAPSIAFPRAAALSLWGWLISAVIFLTSVVLKGGIGGTDTDAARLGNVSLGGMMVALALASVSVATTVMSSRPEGMGLARVPLFSWSMLVAATVWILTIGSAFAHVLVGQISQADATGLAENFANGLSWLLRAPAVYVLAIPVLGIAADAVCAASGRPLRQYGVLQGLVAAFGILSFGVWAQTGTALNTALWTVFALAIAVPVLGLLGGLGDAMRRGSVTVSPALLAGLLSLVLLLGAVLCGLLVALDLAGSGRLFGLAQGALFAGQALFVVGAAVLGGIAGLLHWAPLIWGGAVHRGTGGLAVVLVLAGSGILGTVGLVESIVTRDDPTAAAALLGAFGALGSLLFLLGVLGALAGSVTSAREASEHPGAEPAGSGLTLEWAFPRPAVGDAVPELPAVTSATPLLTEEND